MRVLHMTFEMTDEEAATLLANIGAAGVVTGVSHTAPAAVSAPVAAAADTAPAPAAADDTAEKPKGRRGRPPKAEAAPVADTSAPAAAPVGLPGVMPAAPVGLPMPAAPVTKPPVSYETLIAKYSELSSAGKISAEQAIAFYAECGITDPATLSTNETQRRALMDRLESIS